MPHRKGVNGYPGPKGKIYMFFNIKIRISLNDLEIDSQKYVYKFLKYFKRTSMTFLCMLSIFI